MCELANLSLILTLIRENTVYLSLTLHSCTPDKWLQIESNRFTICVHKHLYETTFFIGKRMRSFYRLLACVGIQKKDELICNAYVFFFHFYNEPSQKRCLQENNMLV